MKYFNFYAKFRFLYFISTPFNCLLLRFWFYLRYKIISTFYLTFTMLSFNLLHFISTPSNRLPTCVWFYLRYKIRKIIQSSVLSFSNVLKVVNFFLPYLWLVFLVLLGRKPDARVLHQLRKVLLPVSSLVVHKIYCATLGNIVRVYPWII